MMRILRPTQTRSWSSQTPDWGNWEKLNTYELERGEALGKTRLKVCNKDEMLKLMK